MSFQPTKLSTWELKLIELEARKLAHRKVTETNRGVTTVHIQILEADGWHDYDVEQIKLPFEGEGEVTK